MFSARFDTLIDEFPEESAAVGRLLNLVHTAQSRPGHKEFKADRLYTLLQPSNYRVLVQILSSAVEIGLLSRSFRVLSRNGGGIGDFDSLLEIPEQLYDSRIGQTVTVSPDDIELIFAIKQS